MFYKKFTPCKELSNYIECYFVWENDEKDATPFVVESPPPGFTSIVFNSGDDYFVSTRKKNMQKVPRTFITGQNTHSYSLHFPGKIAISGIVFKPTGIASIFNIPMYTLTEERIDISIFLPPEYILASAEKIANTYNPPEKANLLEEFIYYFFLNNKPEPDVIDLAANLIVEKHGLVTISSLCKEFFISRRHFERRFLEKVGLSAKYYARLRRMSYLCSQIAGKKEINWKDYYYEAEFSNQSHFIRDFIEFTGRPPKEYLNTNNELVHFLK